MIAIIDYGAGNLKSVEKAFAFLGYNACITQDKDIISSADAVVLPGVGAFGDAMQNIRKRSLENTISDIIAAGKPFLGICLGLQLLFETSEETPGVTGLGILHGDIVKIPKSNGLKIPHMGWNSIDIVKKDGLFKGIDENPFVYFVHSYYLKPADSSCVSARVDYGSVLDIAVSSKNIHATQFHPEKSGNTGLKMLDNFAKMSLDGGAF